MIIAWRKALQRNEIDSINESLGTDQWQKKLKQYQAKQKTHELFKDFFIKQLGTLGYKTTEYCILSTDTKSPQYYLIFATYDNEIYSTHRQMEKNVQELKEKEWVKKTAVISYRINKITKDQTSLSGFT